MARFGLIIGSGELPWPSPWRALPHTSTRYGEPSGPVTTSGCADHEIFALARHGVPHRLAPHAINYRANLRALADQQVAAVLALNTVGGICAQAQTGRLLIPDQIIDYTSGRPLSFHADDDVHHIDFSEPYDAKLRAALLAAG
ncbi:MAG: S-methyl-5'-thioadenosine phosphorylase, partial [Pseudomonadales bacterium]|nr:S-methyl-5'-thioadenosine phosphorylase [Pseudomonadales bacterium]